MKHSTVHSAGFVEAVNLAYHEEEAALYDGRHPEILNDELDRWRRIGETVAALKHERGSLSLLDLGTGTGFVPRQLNGVLGSEDTFTITDLSPAMLSHAEKNLAAEGFRPRLITMISPADRLALAAASFDVITMNSVVHHFPDVAAVFRAADRALRPGGIIVIAHEPNALHFRQPVVSALDRLFRVLRQARNAWRGGDGSGDAFIDGVNRRLLERKIVTKPLSPEEIESVTDIHSPTAGRTVRVERGFDPDIVAAAFPGYRRTLFATYQYFGKVNPAKSALLRPLVGWVEHAWPDAGALFMIVLRKPSNAAEPSEKTANTL